MSTRTSLARLTQPLSAETAAQVPHGTTVLGLKFADGIVDGGRPAGDRRATRSPTTRCARCSRPTTTPRSRSPAPPGMAVEIVKLFQLELEHYEKLTGDRLSLEGKANRLAQMIRSNFPLAMQGLVVVPLFGGYDERRARGPALLLRRHGRALGRGGLPVHRLGQPAGEELPEEALEAGPRPRGGASGSRWRPSWTPPRRTSPPAGPNPVRHIYPIDAHRHRGSGADEMAEDEVAAAVDAVLEERSLMSFMPYVAPEQMMKDRSEYAHKGIARGTLRDRPRDTPTACCSSPRTPPRPCTRSARSTTGSRSPAWASTASSRTCGSRGSGTPTCAAIPTGARTSRPATSRTPTPRPCPRSSPSR